MSLPTLSIVVPTQGRATLNRLLVSIRSQADAEHVEVLVVADTHSPLLQDVRSLAESHGCRYLELDAGKHDQGYPQITHGYEQASGDSILCIGDDDVYEPGALTVIRQALAEASDPAPHLFKVEMFPGQGCSGRGFYLGVIWRQARLQFGDISTQCAVVPNVKEKLGTWTSDYDFIRQTVEHWGRVVWRPEVIAKCY